MPEISVIVPSYNAEPFLGRCLDSILGQTYRDFELLLIDDGSSDGSLCRCQCLAATDPRVTVFAQENRGVSAARNLGLSKARGRYVVFVDSDDEVHPEMLGLMWRAAERHCADLIQCLFEVVPEGCAASRSSRPAEGAACEAFDYGGAHRRHLVDYIVEGRGGPFVWNRLYRRDLLLKSSAVFVAGLGEDYRFNLGVYVNVGRMAAIGAPPLYFYRKRKNSLSKRSREGAQDLDVVMREKIRALGVVGESVSDHIEGLKRWYWLNYTNLLIKQVRRRCWSGMGDSALGEIVGEKPWKIKLLELGAKARGWADSHRVL